MVIQITSCKVVENESSPTRSLRLKSNDDLVAQVQTKYALDRARAQKDVDAFANGRQL
jgi:hypothetical protein